MLGKGGPGKRPVFFLAAQKLSEPLFGGNPILSQEPRFQKALRQKTLFLSRNSWKGSKNRRQNREQRHEETRPDSTFAALFCLGKAPCPERLRAPKAISRQTRFDNWSLQGSDETLRKPIFLENPNSRPHYRTPAGPIIEPMNRKIRPHYRSLQHAYIYIYIYICAVGRGFGRILPFQKGDLVPGLRPDHPASALVLVFWGFRGVRLACSDSDFPT